MTIILFLIVLAILILVHELGHFFAAKLSNVRVDEFGLGFPPRALSYAPKNSETVYTLNWIPLGGFVKILGEEITEEALSGEDTDRSMIYKPKLTQIGILIAGILGNIIAAWLFISLGFMLGMPASVSEYKNTQPTDQHVAITALLPDSPAAEAGLHVGDQLLSIRRADQEASIHDASDIQDFIGTRTDEVAITYIRGGNQESVTIQPVVGILDGRAALGVGLDTIGIVTLPIHRALFEGARTTVALTSTTAVALVHFIYSAVTGGASLSQLTGPVGLVGLVGDASRLGFTYVLSFTALISINLALINLLPFPALDGGRILFVLIEAVKGSPIRPKIANMLNTVGFALLILLMVVVTYNDIVHLVAG